MLVLDERGTEAAALREGIRWAEMPSRPLHHPTAFHGKAMEQSIVNTRNVIADAARPGLLALVLGSGVLSGAVAAEVRNPKGVAVIIGNVDYEHRDVPDVAYAGRDAEGFRRYVVDVLGFDPENVIHVHDATRRRMFDVLGTRSDPRSELWSYLDPEGGSEVVVFYSGHGVPGTGDGQGYLLPVDADPKAAEDDGYPINLLYENLGKLEEAGSVRVYLDACFSGGSHEGGLVGAASPVYVTPALPEGTEKVVSLTAATGTQIASWDEEARHGLFTHHLLDALYGRGDADGDGEVTAGEAKGYLDRHMTRAARREHRRVQQAHLSGAADVVLASVGGGAFPARPDLDRAAGSEPESEEPEGKKERERTEGPEVEQVVSPPSTPPDHATAEKALGLDRAARMLVQWSLGALEFDAGPVDGAFGPKTRGAIGAWQEAKGYGVTGYLTDEQAEALMAFGREAKAREDAEEERKAREREERVQALRKESELVDDALFAQAKSAGTVEAFQEYLSRLPHWPWGGRHEEEARRLMREAEERERLRPGKVFRDCPECPELVVVREGSFKMGSPSWEAGRDADEGPAHRVTFERPFAVGVYEVTFGEWNACVSGGGCGGHRPSDRGWGRGRRPVINVNWKDAQAYVRWLSRKTGEEYRLLSESEWEYVARAGTTTPFHTGATISAGQANYDGNSTYGSGRKGRYIRKTVEVGSYAPNRFGLHDVHGNVREWVEGCWNGSYRGAPTDGSAWESGDCSWRVVRGGSWVNGPRILRSAYRVRVTAGIRGVDVGFRVARTLTP